MKKIMNQKGFVSIEAVISMIVVLMVFLLGVGFFSYMIPKQNLQEEVRLLSKSVKLEGGITEKVNVNGLKKRWVEKGYAEKESDIKVTLYKETADGNEQETMCEDSSVCENNRLTRGQMNSSKTEFMTMKLVVEFPTNKNSILRPLNFFNTENELSDKYVFVERMMSEYIGG